MSLVPLLQESGDLKRDELFWHYPHYQHYQKGGATPYSAIRKGDFKLIEFLADMHVELYNLQGRHRRTARSRQPDAGKGRRASQAIARLARGSRGADADANPKYDPSKPEANLTRAAEKGDEQCRSGSRQDPRDDTAGREIAIAVAATELDF